MDDVQTNGVAKGMKFVGVFVMKWLSPCVAFVWATIWVAQCQTTSPHQSSSGNHYPATTKSTEVKAPDNSIGVISGDKTGILVSAEWIKKYRDLEVKQHSKIPEDGMIYMEGEQYRIPSKVADHFSDMVRSEPARDKKSKKEEL